MDKKKLLLICLCTGMFGGHYFVTGNFKKGFLYLFTVGLFGIGWLADLFKLAVGMDISLNRYKNVKYGQEEYDFQYNDIDSPEEYPSDFTVFDVETTGLYPDTAQIIQVAAIKYRNFREVDRYVTFVNPRIKIPLKITQLTGINENDVRNAPYIEEVLPKLLKFIGNDVIIAHNAPFDLKFLIANLYRYKKPIPYISAVDTLKMSRKYIKGLENYKLPTLKNYLELSASSHLADEDCYVCAEVYKHCLKFSIE